MAEFVFMLTRNDVTIPDALDVFEQVKRTSVRHVGCKDIGLPRDQLGELIEAIRDSGRTSYIEVVSEDERSALNSARVAAEIRPDYLIGGMQVAQIMEVLDGTGVGFFPYVGEVVDHPCVLRGSIDEIADSAAEVSALGVQGINLLAYRYAGDVSALMRKVIDATELPVLCAGSIASVERIRDVCDAGAWGFTVGTAALDRVFVPDGSLVDQLEAINAAAS